MTLFRDRYRIETTRLSGWDYATAGCYLVTICTRDRVCSLGDAVNGEMRLSAAGEVVAEEWLKTTRLRHNVTLDEWVVMPNHFHGIVCIHDENRQTWPVGVETPRWGVSNRGGVSNRCGCDGQSRDVPPARLYKGTLGSIVGQFKSICTKRILAVGHPFAWQPRFHDRIIRDEKTLATVRAYIRNNPARWTTDRENPANANT